MAFVRNGDMFVRDLRSGALTQITRSNEDDTLPQWSSDGGLVWRVGERLVSLGRAQRRAPGGGGQGGKGSGRQRRDAMTCANASCA